MREIYKAERERDKGKEEKKKVGGARKKGWVWVRINYILVLLIFQKYIINIIKLELGI